MSVLGCEKKFSSDLNVNFSVKMCTSWIDHYCADLNRDPDTYLSKKSIFHLLIPSDLNYEKEKYRNDRF